MSIAMMIEWSILDSGWRQMKYQLMKYGNTDYRVMYDIREIVSNNGWWSNYGWKIGDLLIIYWWWIDNRVMMKCYS